MLRMEPRRNHLKSAAKKDVPTESRPEGSAFDTVPNRTEQPAAVKVVQTTLSKEESVLGMVPCTEIPAVVKDAQTELSKVGSVLSTEPRTPTNYVNMRVAPNLGHTKKDSAKGTEKRPNAVMKGVQTSPRNEESAIGMEQSQSAVTKDVRMFP